MLAAAKLAQNCAGLVCSGGYPIVVADYSDLPPSTECIDYSCSGASVIADVLFLAPCSAGVCNEDGDCVACIPEPGCDDWPCPGTEQISGDCQQAFCAEDGSLSVVADDDDVPAPAPDCTVSLGCNGGVITSVPAEAGDPCHGSDGECTADGECACVGNCECATDSDCAVAQYCIASVCQLGFCESEPVTVGYSPYQVSGDCQMAICSDVGVTSVGWFDPPPPLPCATGTCTLFTPDCYSNPGGSPCGVGGYCDGVSWACWPCYNGDGDCPAGFHCPSDPGFFSCAPD